MIEARSEISDLSLLALIEEESRLTLSKVVSHCDGGAVSKEIVEQKEAAGAHVTLTEFFSEPSGQRLTELTRIAREWDAELSQEAFDPSLPIGFLPVALNAGPTGMRLLVHPASRSDIERLDAIVERFACLPRPSWMPAPRLPASLHLTTVRNRSYKSSHAETPNFPVMYCDAVALAVAALAPYGAIRSQFTYRPLDAKLPDGSS